MCVLIAVSSTLWAHTTYADDKYCCILKDASQADCGYTTAEACKKWCEDTTPKRGRCEPEKPSSSSPNTPAGTFGGEVNQTFTFSNPLSCDDAQCLVKRFIDQLNIVAVFLAILALIISAIMFVSAYLTGNEGLIKTARQTALYAVIGYAVVLAAKGVVEIVNSIFQ